MNIEAVTLLDLHPNFVNLTLFVCQLFAGGGFRTAYILFDKVAIDDTFLSEIDAKCPTYILKTTTEISRFGRILSNKDENQQQRSDHILQFIFVQYNQVVETLRRVTGLLSFYRIFIFSSNRKLDPEAKFTESIWKDLSRNSSTLVIFHNASNGEVKVHSLSKMKSIPLKSVDFPKELSTSRNEYLFDLMLGSTAFDRSFGMIFVYQVHCPTFNATYDSEKSIAHLYYKRLKMSYIDAIHLNCDTGKPGVISVQHGYARPQSKLTYSDLAYKTVNIDSSGNYTNGLYQTSSPIVYEKLNIDQMHVLPAYKPRSIRVFFVYAIGMNHQNHRSNLSKYWRDPVLHLLIAVFFVSVLSLYFLRRVVHSRGANCFDGCFEITSTVIGGGNIRIQHHLERTFFAIVMLTSFLLIPIYFADFSMHSVLLESEKVNTFEKLAEQDVPIRVSSVISAEKKYISELLGKKLRKSVTVTIGVAIFYSKSDIHSFACVVPEMMLEQYIMTYIYNGREIEVIKEELGVLSANFYLKSDQYIPQHTIDRINRVTTDLNENGWFDFVSNLITFYDHLKTKMEDFPLRHELEFKPITSEEFAYVLKAFLVCVLFSVFVFFVEILLNYFRQIGVVWMIIKSLGHLSSK